MDRVKNIDGCRDIASVDFLLNVAEAATRPWWKEDELGAILRHQLDAPLLFDLRRVPASEVEAPEVPGTFGQLLFGRKPPLRLLELMKEFAKTCDSPTDNPLPQPVATVLYYAAIVAARISHASRITELSEQDVHEGIEWAIRQTWIDDRLRNFFRTGLGQE